MKSSTSEICTEVNRILCEHNKENMFATAWIGILNTKKNVLNFTNAGHNPACELKQGEGFSLVKSRHGLFIAGMDDTQYKQTEIQLNSGDCVFLYTDGLTEAHNTNKKIYGEKRLLEKLNSLNMNIGCKKVIEELNYDVDLYAKGTEQFDDITLLMIKIL